MTLQWLGQGQVMGLVPGHMYRGRWLIPGAGDFPCPLSQGRLDQLRTILGGLGGGSWETPSVLQSLTGLDMLAPPWPADRREVPAGSYAQGTCVVWTQSTLSSPLNLPVDLLKSAAAPLGGFLLNFWDETSGQRLVDQQPTSPTPPVNIPPIFPPIFPPVQPPFPPTATPPLPPTPTPVPQPEKKTSPAVWLLGGAVLVGAVMLLTSR